MIKIPDHLEGKVAALIAIPVIALVVYMINKEPKFSCAEWAKDIKNEQSFHMIFSESSGSAKDVTLYGRDLNNHLTTEYNDQSGWLDRIIDTLKKGDTITKQKGQYCIMVRRKNKVFLVPIICDKEYTDTIKQR